MAKNILIADTAFQQTFNLAERVRRIKNCVISPLSSDNSKTFSGDAKSSIILWNRESSFSALGAVREACGKEQGFDVAIVVFNPLLAPPAAEFGVSDIEQLIQTHIRSYLLLFKEIDNIFNSREGGLLIPILYRKSNELSPYEKIAASTFFATVEQIIQNKERRYSVRAIDCGNLLISNVENLVVQLIVENNDGKNTGKWFEPDARNPLRALFSKF